MTAQTQAIVDAQQQQDALRPLRQFVTLLSNVMNDQTWAGQDAYAVNAPAPYQVMGPNGYSIEGRPIATTTNDGAVVISPVIVWALVGAAAVYFLR